MSEEQIHPLELDHFEFEALDKNSSPHSAEAPNNTLKNIDRIQGIRSRICATKRVTLYTPFARRQLRRDFNIACAKMYVYGLNKAYKVEIVEALESLEFAVQLLEMDVCQWSGNENPLTPCVFDMYLVSPQSVRMLRILLRLDVCLIGVYSAFLNSLITKDQKRDFLGPFNLAYLNFKRVAMKLELNGVAEQMVDDIEQEVRFS